MKDRRCDAHPQEPRRLADVVGQVGITLGRREIGQRRQLGSLGDSKALGPHIE
jgi:hypothetical protein